HTVSAIYNGDLNFSSSNGTLTQTVSSALTSVLVVTGVGTPLAAGAPRSFVVTAQDPYGNTAAGYRGTVHFSSSDSRTTLPTDYTSTAADNGVHTFTVVFVTAGNQSLTVTDTTDATITGTQSGIGIMPAAPDHFRIVPATSAIVAGAPLWVTITP